MADIHDAIEADQRVNEALENLREAEEQDEVYFATQAVCYAIQSVGIRLDYVLRDKDRIR